MKYPFPIVTQYISAPPQSGRLLIISPPDGVAITSVSDTAGNVYTSCDPNPETGSTLWYTADPAGNVVRIEIQTAIEQYQVEITLDPLDP